MNLYYYDIISVYLLLSLISKNSSLHNIDLQFDLIIVKAWRNAHII